MGPVPSTCREKLEGFSFVPTVHSCGPWTWETNSPLTVWRSRPPTTESSSPLSVVFLVWEIVRVSLRTLDDSIAAP